MPALSFRIPLRFLRGSYSKLALTVVALACGVALVCAIRVMNSAVLASFLDTVDEVGGRATFSVVANDGAGFPESIVDTIAAVGGVRLAVPLVSGVAFPNDDSGELLTVHGVDLTQESAVRLYHSSDVGGATSEIIEDLVAFLNQDDSIVLGKEFAAKRRLSIDDHLELVTPRGVKRFTIRGLLEPQGLARTLSGRLVVMDLFAAQRAFATEGQITRVDVVISDGADPTAVLAAVRKSLPEGLHAEESTFRKDIIKETIAGFQGMLIAFGLLAVVAGFVICYGRLSVVFEMRAWHIGVLRAVGAGRWSILTCLLSESLILGVLGALVGIPLGIGLGYFGLPLLASATAMNFRLPIAAASPTIQLDSIVLGASVSIVAAIIAAMLPALRVANTEVVTALSLRGRETPPLTEGGSSWLRWCIVGAVVAAVLGQQVLPQFVVLGNLTTGLVGVGACAFAAPLTHVGGRWIASRWEKWFGPTGRLASRNLAEHPRRTSLTVAILGVGLGVVFLFGILGWSFERTLVAASTARLQSDLIVSSAFSSGGYRSAAVTEDLIAKLEQVAGVAKVAGVQERDVAYREGSAVLYGYDQSCFTDPRVCQWPLVGSPDGALERVATGEAVLVSTSFAHQLGLGAGDVIHIPAPDGTLDLPIAAVTTAEPVKAIIMERSRYRSLWNDRHVSWIYVALQSGEDVETVRTSIAAGLGREYRLRIQSNAELVEYFASQARKAFSLQYVMEGITFALLLIGMGDTLAAGVAERTYEFGLMRAIGVRRRVIFGMVVLESSAIGVLGLTLALAVGVALGAFWVDIQFPAILGWKLDLHLPTGFILTAALLSLAICLTASLLPSWRAAKLEPAEALRYE